MKLHVDDKVGYQGIDYRVDDILTYTLADRGLRLARLVGAGTVRFLEPATDGSADRALVLAEIAKLDITTPPPDTLYHRGESYLLKISGAATVTNAGGDTRTCKLWRYRAAGDQFLQIEQWPEKVRMFAGASVHVDMLEIRPATLKNETDTA
ncbi:MAG TPA: DUF4178 domain-containing protein [Polyangia bacterium]|jgi:hypothetical protein